jgi:hypothetical protein
MHVGGALEERQRRQRNVVRVPPMKIAGTFCEAHDRERSSG